MGLAKLSISAGAEALPSKMDSVVQKESVHCGRRSSRAMGEWRSSWGICAVVPGTDVSLTNPAVPCPGVSVQTHSSTGSLFPLLFQGSKLFHWMGHWDSGLWQCTRKKQKKRWGNLGENLNLSWNPCSTQAWMPALPSVPAKHGDSKIRTKIIRLSCIELSWGRILLLVTCCSYCCCEPLDLNL